MTPFDRTRATLALDGAVTTVAQVSAKRAQALGKMGIRTVRELIGNYPRRYIDMSDLRTIADATIGRPCTIKAQIHEVKVKNPKPRLSLTEVTLVDGTGTLIVTFFRQPWLKDSIKAGMTIAVSGKMLFDYGYKRMTNPYMEVIEGDGEGMTGMIIAVHPLTGAIKAGMMRRLIANALQETLGAIDPLPVGLRAKYRLMSRESAFTCIHFPRSMEEQRQARRRLAYEEVLLLELKLMSDSSSRGAEGRSVAHEVEGRASELLAKAVPFQLTDEQEEARRRILDDMAKPETANHMLLGDVGTGKTIVAAFALAAVHDTGTQALFMAPTEILAQQHAKSLGDLLDAAGVSWALLTGSTDREERKRILKGAASGEITVLFGTHALLEPDVHLKDCSLVIIDEQQRFGVEQRQRLLEKGEAPDALYLTATPIPRTLALALFGNLTLSYLHERPRALAPRTTEVHPVELKGAAYDAARAALARGEQVYIVCPLVGVKPASSESDEGEDHPIVEEDRSSLVYGSIQIEDENDMDMAAPAAAESEAAFLRSKVFPESRVGLLHGKLPSDEKQQVMEDFQKGDIDVLVATTVIEVGIDVPNATVMIIQDADRFGLSQLHQLRGRVGRGEKPGEVHLISATKDPIALERLQTMERTDDGFELASFDLSLRHEGDILGNRQHGASVLKLVNIVRDSALIEAAWSDAKSILEDDPTLTSEMYRPLGREATILYQHAEESLAS